ncbi:type IV pilus inner membrane component PilO [Acinetobacter stercoris]|uniref:Pilus assembly protein, PilO n=1 Tax=Acinetobacter stercoris TaxID=2126983 RepID=A0A2U3MU02_9GAMM|nr:MULTISPECIES: type 4a pilus biogenesis protein PilO [Acinetobacter]SPL68833.1 Pilus assembly protein, PilO [Acinetobacter stercoris]
MSSKKLDNLNTEAQVNKKAKLSLNQFFKQFNSLDMNNYGAWSFSVKLTCWILIFLCIFFVGFLLVIQPKLNDISIAQAQQANLLKEFKEKDSKLRNLQLYQNQLQEMEAKFNQQLQQLPKETEIPSLVQDINEAGVHSGLKFKNIRLENEVKQEIFIEQPISIEITGDYQSFGAFVSAIAALPRIVTLHDFVISTAENPKKKSDIPEIEYSVKAKTYRYIGEQEKNTEEKPE